MPAPSVFLSTFSFESVPKQTCSKLKFRNKRMKIWSIYLSVQLHTRNNIEYQIPADRMNSDTCMHYNLLDVTFSLFFFFFWSGAFWHHLEYKIFCRSSIDLIWCGFPSVIVCLMILMIKCIFSAVASTYAYTQNSNAFTQKDQPCELFGIISWLICILWCTWILSKWHMKRKINKLFNYLS